MPLEYRTHRITSPQELKAGDHIRMRGCNGSSGSSSSSGGSSGSSAGYYWHHMLVVCVNDNKLRVIHNNGTTITEEVVCFSSYDVVEKIEYVKLPESATKYSPDEAIKRARSRVGETDYNVVSNNCEHFVNWAKTGIPQSNQVDSAVRTTVTVGVLGAIGIGVVALAGAIAYGRSGSRSRRGD